MTTTAGGRSEPDAAVVCCRQVDLQRRSGLSRAGELTLGLVEQIVFGGDLDGALRAALKNRRDVAAMFVSQPLSALIDDIEEALKTAASAADDDMIIVDKWRWWRSPRRRRWHCDGRAPRGGSRGDQEQEGG